MSKVVDTIAAMAELYQMTLSRPAAMLLLEDLQEFTEFQILRALERCRRELKRFPSTSDILDRIDDGRPGIEEAWGMIPKSEGETVVWTQEMATAFGACASLIDRDQVAARMTFKEVYENALSIARAERKPVKWSASLGHYAPGRDGVIKAAVQRGRLAADEALALLPHLANDKSVMSFKRIGSGSDAQIGHIIRDMMLQLPEPDKAAEGES